MITQDSLRFYKNHGVYKRFGGVVLAEEEGLRIAKALGTTSFLPFPTAHVNYQGCMRIIVLTGQCIGNTKAVILQNHGILTVGQTVDEAAFWFLSLDKTCHAQLLVDAASAGSGHEKKIIPDKEAEESYTQVGTPEKGWLAFQGYYDEILHKTNGDFLL